MNIIYMGENQAGCVGFLTLCCSWKSLPQFVITKDPILKRIVYEFEIYTFMDLPSDDEESCVSIRDGFKLVIIPDPDLFVSVHGRKIVSQKILNKFKHGGINVHPCLYAYKGKDPIGHLLADGNTKASVGVHRMTEKVDEGEVLVEEFVDVTGCKTREEVYNKLYPYYSIALIKAMRMIG